MPLYDFYCETCDESEEVHFDFHAEQKLVCSECGAQMKKTIFPAGVIFRGTGWGGQ